MKKTKYVVIESIFHSEALKNVNALTETDGWQVHTFRILTEKTYPVYLYLLEKVYEDSLSS